MIEPIQGMPKVGDVINTTRGKEMVTDITGPTITTEPIDEKTPYKFPPSHSRKDPNRARTVKVKLTHLQVKKIEGLGQKPPEFCRNLVDHYFRYLELSKQSHGDAPAHNITRIKR